MRNSILNSSYTWRQKDYGILTSAIIDIEDNRDPVSFRAWSPSAFGCSTPVCSGAIPLVGP